MSGKMRETRRSFLLGTGAGAAASAALASEAEARVAARSEHAGSMPHAGMSGAHGAFFSDDDLATIAALAERIMPAAPGKPGAKDAGVANYIDLALSGAYADQQDFYRHGLRAFDAYCNEAHKESFVFLKGEQQDAAIAALQEGKASGFTWPSARDFFNTLRMHVMEGMFADPIYGGNHDFAGWRLVGFPGAQATFTEADMASDKPFTRAPIVGLQARGKALTRRG